MTMLGLPIFHVLAGAADQRLASQDLQRIAVEGLSAKWGNELSGEEMHHIYMFLVIAFLDSQWAAVEFKDPLGNRLGRDYSRRQGQ